MLALQLRLRRGQVRPQTEYRRGPGLPAQGRLRQHRRALLAAEVAAEEATAVQLPAVRGLEIRGGFFFSL